MRIAIVNDDTKWGPRDPDEARLGAASLAPEYLARALVRRGHTVLRFSHYPRTRDCGNPLYWPLSAGGEHVAADAAILSRNRYLADRAGAPVQFLWTGDEHNTEEWERWPELKTVCTSQYLAGIVARRVPVAAVIPVGVPDSLFGIPIHPEERAWIYTSGVWDPCRGTLEAVAALQRVAAADVFLELFGDSRLWGRDPNGYSHEVEQALRGLRGKYYVHGTVSHAAMLDALPYRGVLLHMATSETCGVAVTEAMAAGIPVVATGAAALAELGLHRHCRGVDEAADELRRLVGDPDYYARVARGSREAVRDRAWSKVAERWERLIEEHRP